LYGVISWGPIICGDKPAVFTNIAHVSDWMQSILEEAGECRRVECDEINAAGEDIDPGSAANAVDGGVSTTTQSSQDESNVPNEPPCDAG
jgi:secreted trypsin-like serine protease